MTLRDYVKEFLKRVLVWAKANRDYFGEIKKQNEVRFDTELWIVQHRFNQFLKRFAGEK